MTRFVALALLAVSTALFAQADIYRVRFSEEKTEGVALRTFRGEAHFPHPPEMARKVLTDYGRFKEFFPLMTESEVLSKPNLLQVKFRSRFPLPAFRAVVEFEERSGPEGTTISWKKVDGNVRELSGSARIAAEGEKKDASVLFVEFRFDPGKMWPQWVVAKAAKPYMNEAMNSLGRHAAKVHYDEIRKKRTVVPSAPAKRGK
jgi:hypothetical protein